jgi:hypothetical protein
MSPTPGQLTPGLARKYQELDRLAGAEGIKLKLTSTARGFGKQARMWNAYRRSPAEARDKYGVVSEPAPAGRTRHHPFFDGKAAAFDATPTSWPEHKFPDKVAVQERVGELAEGLGLLWGGRWKKPDRVHFEEMVDGKRFDVSKAFQREMDKLDRLAGIIEEETA